MSCHTRPHARSRSARLPRSLPGSVAQRQLLDSFSRMIPELLRFSSAHHLLAKIPEELQRVHRQDRKTTTNAPEVVINTAKSRAIARSNGKRAAAPAAPAVPLDLWDDSADAERSHSFLDFGETSLSSLGL